jgi:hypothetical protein
MKTITLNTGKEVMVDDEDYEELSKYHWTEMKLMHQSYAKRTKCKRNAYMHREIMNPENNMQIDHIDGDGLNNTRINLRICTQSQNFGNSKKRCITPSKYKGVTWDKRNKNWVARIRKDKKTYNLGRFEIEREAAYAYNKAALELFGEFALVNEIGDYEATPIEDLVNSCWKNVQVVGRIT